MSYKAARGNVSKESPVIDHSKMKLHEVEETPGIYDVSETPQVNQDADVDVPESVGLTEVQNALDSMEQLDDHTDPDADTCNDNQNQQVLERAVDEAMLDYSKYHEVRLADIR